MRLKVRHVAGIALLLALGSGVSVRPASAADATLQAQPKLAKDFDAFPRVSGGIAPDVAKRINDGLVRADAKGRKAIADCRKQDPRNGYWERSVEVTMLGPRYLSLVSRDNAMCGWAHPNNSSMALVYDLTDGKLVDLAKLLPGLVTKTALEETLDGSRIGTISSPRLLALYLGERKKDAGLDPECRQVSAERKELSFIAYPEAKAHSLVLEPVGIENVVQACFDTMTVTGAVLATQGTSAEFLEALRAARK